MAEPQLRAQPGENAPTPAREESAVDTLVHAIKGFIQENNLQIGDALPSERELGERFDAARNTVREAVRTLKAYGVVDVRPKVGAVIVNRHMDAVLDLFSFQLTMNRKTFIDIQGFRRLIEVGSVETSALTPFLSDELRGQMEALTPMGRLGQVEDIAIAALYLASPASSWVTGKIFPVDGGTEATNWPFDPPKL